MNSLNKVNIVLDIDGVLCCHKTLCNEEAFFFKKKGEIITAIKTHYIFPGVIEFIKLLHQTESVRVSFFSSGNKERNEILVKHLLDLALPEIEYKEIKKNVCILSHEDLNPTTEKERREKEILYGLRGGEKHKDISKVLKENDLIENTILIDDNCSYVKSKQEKNFLYVPGTYKICSISMSEKLRGYELDGRPPAIVLTTEEPSKNLLGDVKKGRQIRVVSQLENYEIYFQDNKTYKIRKEIINDQGNELLISKLNDAMESPKICEDGFEFSNNQNVKNKLCSLVHSLGGTTRKIHLKTNRIFYATGLLFRALEMSKLDRIPVSEALFNLQYKKNKMGDGHYLSSEKIKKRKDHYLFGLEKLQGINKNLALNTPHDYIQITNLMKTERASEEMEIYRGEEEYRKEEDRSCYIA